MYSGGTEYRKNIQKRAHALKTNMSNVHTHSYYIVLRQTGKYFSCLDFFLNLFLHYENEIFLHRAVILT